MPAAVDRKRALIEHDGPHLSICRRCELLGLNRSTYYLRPAVESAEAQPADIMDLMAASTFDLFQGRNVTMIEQLWNERRGITPRSYGSLVWHYIVLNRKPHTKWDEAASARASAVSTA